MTRRITALLLSLALLLSMAACTKKEPTAQPTDRPTDPPRETTAAPTVPPTEAPTVPATEPVPETTQPPVVSQPEVSRSVALSVSGDPLFPLMTSIGDAALQDYSVIEDSVVSLKYANADETAVNIFITVCSFFGLYSYGGTWEDNILTYFLLRPGTDYMAVIALDASTGEMVIHTPINSQIATEEEIDSILTYYLQDLTLPTGYGPNVHPQFYTSIGRVQPDRQGFFPNFFGGDAEECWAEEYYDVDYQDLHIYLSDMMLCGFEISLNDVSLDDNGVLTTAVLQLDNGTSCVAVAYSSDSGNVQVFYRPGDDRYLLSGSEYTQYIPQS